MTAPPKLALFSSLVVWGDLDEISIQAKGPRCEVDVNAGLRWALAKPRARAPVPITIEAECMDGDAFTEAVTVPSASQAEIRSLLIPAVASRAVDPHSDPLTRWTAFHRANALRGSHLCGQPITSVRLTLNRQDRAWNTSAAELDADLFLAHAFKAGASGASLPERVELEVHTSSLQLPPMRMELLPDLVQPSVRDLAGYQCLVAKHAHFAPSAERQAATRHLAALWGTMLSLRKSRPGAESAPVQPCPACGRAIPACNAYHHGQAVTVPQLHPPAAGAPALQGLCAPIALRRHALDPVPLSPVGRPMFDRLADRMEREWCWDFDRRQPEALGSEVAP